MNVIKKYLEHLAKDPERIDSMLMWSFCTIIIWIVIWVNREKFLKGLAADGRHPGDPGTDNLDAREIIIYIFLFVPIPVIFNVAFFHHVDTWQVIAMWAVLAPLYYQIFGRFIFDWALAFKSGASKVTETPDTTTTTTTTTETK